LINWHGGDLLLYVFTGCFAFGVLYAAVSFILGGHGDHSAGEGSGIGDSLDIDAGDGLDIAHDIDIGQGDLVGDMSGADAGDGVDIQHGTDTADSADSTSPSPFNPLVIASAITTFGAVGLISMKGFGLGDLASTIVALSFAGAIGAALFFGIVKFMYGSQSNSIFSLNDLIGTEADVLTPVPETGLGEIVFIANGTRYTLGARSLEGDVIRRGETVIIREIAGSIAVVQKKLTIDDIELYSRTDASAGSKDRSAGRTDASAGSKDGSADIADLSAGSKDESTDITDLSAGSADTSVDINYASNNRTDVSADGERASDEKRKSKTTD
jgi:hypothetical protein